MSRLIRYSLLSNLAITMNSSNDSRRAFSLSRLLSVCPRLISPISWWHSFSLLYNPMCYETNPSLSLLKNSFRISSKSFKYILLHIFLLIFVGLWCYLYWMITFDAGQYFTLLSSISSNATNITDGRRTFDQLIWRTALKTFFISVDFGLINACAVTLAALWRQRLCKQFYKIIFRSPNGCILYETAQQTTYDLPTQLTNDIRQFTSNLSIALFGSLFFSGLIAVSTVVVVFSVYIVQKTNGDKSGIGICFGAFAFSITLVFLISYRFNRTAVEQLRSKGKVRSFLQRLQTCAECVAFYASSRACELPSLQKLYRTVHRWNVRAAFLYSFVTFPMLFMDVMGSCITYILPAVLFFFLRKSAEQTPADATKYLSIIAFYGYVFWLLSSLIYINESCLIALTLGDNLWKLKQRLLRLQAFHQRRLRHDQVAEIKFEAPDLIELVKLRIIVPDDMEQRVLQSNINLLAPRGECVLVNGATGCGKTSLFRICAGLWPIEAERVRLPARRQTIYVPQRPYLPIGSLRFQALFLLDVRGGTDSILNVDDQRIRELFQLVNMDYLLDRYELDTVVEWSTYLSIGEQQRLAFIRLFALFQYSPNEVRNTLVMLDESTSAVDTKTEAVIYQLLNDLRVWFVTISHRPSLMKYHQKELKLYSKIRDSRENNLELNEDDEDKAATGLPLDQAFTPVTTDENIAGETQLVSVSIHNNVVGYIDVKTTDNWLKQIRGVWRLIHLPFGPDDRKLRIQTYVAWFICLSVLGVYTYISYRVTVQTGAIFTVMPDYAASKIDINEGRAQIRGLIWPYILHLIGLTVLYSIQLGIGQFIGALYTRRQSSYISRLLLDDEEHQYTLYHSTALKLLPSIISHDLAEMNVQLFYLLIGSMYYNGIIGVLAKLIPYTLLLVQQSGSGKGVIIVYGYQLFISTLILCAIRPFYRVNVKYENSFALLTNAQKRIDLQAEQIALSDQSVIDVEQAQLQSKLDASIKAQKHSGLFYGVLVACSVLGNWSNTIINYGIPSMIFFHFTANPTFSQAASIITLTVYTGYLQSNLAVFNSHGQPFSQVWTIGRRIAQNLEELMKLRQLHRQLRSAEFTSGRRIEVHPSNNFQNRSFALNQVDVTIPSAPSTVLIRALSFSLDSPSSLIITGASGCGKSSLLRLLAGLQYNIIENSSITVPSRLSTIYIPQQVFLIEGTLREQLNYFRQVRHMPAYTNDQKLKDLLFKFNLIHLVDRYTLDASVHLWSRTLSLGEQQRLIIVVALLTLLPPLDTSIPVKSFILDETTAGCDELTEKTIYEYLQNSNIQYISISHRSQLIKYHTHQLTINPKNQSYELVQLA